MNRRDFIKWFNTELIAKFSGHAPKHIDKWVNRYYDNHQEIKDKLGKNNQFEIQTSLSMRNIIYYATNINNNCPGLFKDQKDLEHLLSDTININGKEIKIEKYVLDWCKKKKMSDIMISYVNSYLSSIADLRKRYKKTTYYHLISIDPRSICCLGQYACDQGSCFKQGSFNSIMKYYFGLWPNSFIGYLSSKPIKEDDLFTLKKQSDISRYLGIINYKQQFVDVTNYHSDPTHRSCLFPDCLIDTFGPLFGSKDLSVINNSFSFKGKLNYHSGANTIQVGNCNIPHREYNFDINVDCIAD